MRLFARAGEIMRKEMAPRAGTAFARFGRAGAEVRIRTIREARGPCLARCRRAARLRLHVDAARSKRSKAGRA
ncbi:hypothetical protein BURPS668_1830 [Burkholderia pseudomallei 668]|nr:hypothetical protein BURPS668_1830 [Burkholderia pseudomallei 668]